MDSRSVLLRPLKALTALDPAYRQAKVKVRFVRTDPG
jgi:hypothetical protein